MNIPGTAALRTRFAVAITLGVSVGLAVLIAEWPGWTLRYIQALAWPLVVLAGIALLGPALARRVPSLSALHLPGGVIATFTQETVELDAAWAAELEEAEAWGPGIDHTDAGPLGMQDEPSEDPLALANEGIRLLGTILGAYQIQLDYLRVLGTADHGLTQAATRQWFSDAIATRGADPDTWNLDNLAQWLVGQGTVSVEPDGSYQLTTFGQRTLVALDIPGIFVAPKAL